MTCWKDSEPKAGHNPGTKTGGLIRGTRTQAKFQQELKQERANGRDMSKRETGNLGDMGHLACSVSRACDFRFVSLSPALGA